MEKDDTVRGEIAARLRMARESAGLTQAQVAKKLSLHRPTISEIEAGRRRVTAEELTTMADLYGVEVNWIIDTSTSEQPESDKIVMAARQLSKLKDRDLDRLMNLVRMLRGPRGKDDDK